MLHAVSALRTNSSSAITEKTSAVCLSLTCEKGGETKVFKCYTGINGRTESAKAFLDHTCVCHLGEGFKHKTVTPEGQLPNETWEAAKGKCGTQPAFCQDDGDHYGK